MQADKSRVKDYINRLDNFDGPAVGEIAVGYEMFEEAFEIYKKFGLKSQAIRVLLDHQGDLDRAFEYAGKVNLHPIILLLRPCVWHNVSGITSFLVMWACTLPIPSCCCNACSAWA